MNEENKPPTAAPLHGIVMRHFSHPWDGRIGWVTQQHESPDHQAASYGAAAMMTEGWHVWIVSNEGTPGFVVYREHGVEFDGERLQICTVCNQVGTVGRCCGRDTHRDLEEADLSA
jgi:hypothetical protein